MARLLIDARTAGESIDSLPPAFAPADVVEAQLVDDRVAELSGWPVLGWKIGCTSEHAQKLLGADGPFAGRIYSIHQSGVVLADDELMVEPKLEGEIAFEIGHDLGPFDGACERSVVSDAVSAVMPAIEFVGGRFTTFIGAPLLHVIADAGSNSLLVVGDRIDPACVDGLDAAPSPPEVVTGRDPADAVYIAAEGPVRPAGAGTGDWARAAAPPPDEARHVNHTHRFGSGCCGPSRDPLTACGDGRTGDELLAAAAGYEARWSSRPTRRPGSRRAGPTRASA